MNFKQKNFIDVSITLTACVLVLAAIFYVINKHVIASTEIVHKSTDITNKIYKIENSLHDSYLTLQNYVEDRIGKNAAHNRISKFANIRNSNINELIIDKNYLPESVIPEIQELSHNLQSLKHKIFSNNKKRSNSDKQIHRNEVQNQWELSEMAIHRIHNKFLASREDTLVGPLKNLAFKSMYLQFFIILFLASTAFLLRTYFSNRIRHSLNTVINEIRDISYSIASDTYGNSTAQGQVQNANLGANPDELQTLQSVVQLLKQGIQRKEDLAEALKAEHSRSLFSSKMAGLGEMAGGIAHEINTPLAVVTTRASQLREVISEDPEIDRELLIEMSRDIESTCLRIGRIVKSLKSFSRDGSHDPCVQTKINDIYKETQVFCLQKFKEKNVKLEFKDFDQALVIECRETEFTQVFLNMLNNAFDAVESLNEKWVCVSTSDFGDSVEIRITDSGKGIPDTVQRKLFQPFFTTKNVGKGTGLGLSISRRIIENHGGILIINSDSPNTEFIIWVPKLQSFSVKKSA